MHFSHSRINRNCHLKVINVTMFTLNKWERAGQGKERRDVISGKVSPIATEV